MTDGKIEKAEFDWIGFRDEISSIFANTETTVLDKSELSGKLADLLYERIADNPDLCSEIRAEFVEFSSTVWTNRSELRDRRVAAGFLLPIMGTVLDRFVRGSKNVPAEGADQPIQDARKLIGDAVGGSAVEMEKCRSFGPLD